MKQVEPEVYLVAETVLNDPRDPVNSMTDFLRDAGASDEWSENDSQAHSDCEELIEVMGRLCYRSFTPDLNPNVKKVSKGNAQYLRRLVAQKHGSVLEHSSVSFIFRNISRVFSHELVRHRVGTAFSQESLRFVRLEELDFWFPKAFTEHPKAEGIRTLLDHAIGEMEHWQKELARLLDLDNLPFSEKKKLTSAMRRIAPIGLATSIGFTANFRTLRWLIEMRTSRHSEEEIRLVFGKVAEICTQRYPNAFGDFTSEEVDGYLEWVPEHSKV